jgi:CRP/FNR family transcriptional regulator, cyclic AMP receptor protein
MLVHEKRLEGVLPQNPHLEVLRRVSIFTELDDAALLGLLRQMTIKRWHGGAIIVGQQEPGDALYVQVSGRSKVVLFGENGREMTLSVIEPGGFFGEMALFDDKPRSANVVALEDSVLLVLDRVAFRTHLESNPRTTLKLLGELADRLRRANEIINNLALHDVPSRLARTLVSLAEANGESREDGILIRRRPTQQDLASMVGTCRETVSRALSSMARRGLLVQRGRTLLLSRALLESWRQAA